MSRKIDNILPSALAWFAKHEGLSLDEIKKDADKYYELLSAHEKYPVERKCFRAAKMRATKPDKRHEKNGYKKRGMSPEWLDRFGFLSFIKDVGPMPDYEKENGHYRWTLDRIDNTKGYYPGNCRWATYREQIKNRSNTRWVDVDGKTMPLMDALEKYGISSNVYTARIRYGWPVDRALKTPLKGRRTYGV